MLARRNSRTAARVTRSLPLAECEKVARVFPMRWWVLVFSADSLIETLRCYGSFFLWAPLTNE